MEFFVVVVLKTVFAVVIVVTATEFCGFVVFENCFILNVFQPPKRF